jgi:hypothetical protein
MIDRILAAVFINQWSVIGVVSALLLLSSELGFRIGLRLHETRDEARKGQISGVRGAVLGLLGLLLAFTFSMSANRYERRRDLMVEEANAIGTTYLRVSLLPEAHHAALQDLIRRYLDVRLDFYEAGADKAAVAAAEDAGAKLQREIWARAALAAKEAPTPLAGTFILALNEMIDVDATRLNALRTHVPGAVWLLVLAAAMVGCCGSGYGVGSSGARNNFANLVLPMLIAVAITLIADLDRPRGGMIRASQQPMLDLRDSLSRSGS